MHHTAVNYYLKTTQNENNQREYTSEKMVLDMRRPDRRTPMKVRVKKGYKFTDKIWKSYVQRNVEEIRYRYNENG